MGVCVLRPPQQDVYAPVCGCDGVTYWNEAVANAAGLSKRADNICAAAAPTTARCGGLAGTVCAGFRRCNYQVESALACNAVNRQGFCWGLPTNCPPTVTETMKACPGGGGGCRSFCEAIRNQEAFYLDTMNCP
jgi:hypothetical protein